MIYGIGTDMIEIERVLKAYDKESFALKIYTERERELIKEDVRKAASNFAVKEAAVKVFGTGFRGCRPNDIEVLRDELGKPYINLYEGAEKLAKERGITQLHVSISNTEDLVTAVVIGSM